MDTERWTIPFQEYWDGLRPLRSLGEMGGSVRSTAARKLRGVRLARGPTPESGDDRWNPSY
jgi:hypothetical protein